MPAVLGLLSGTSTLATKGKESRLPETVWATMLGATSATALAMARGLTGLPAAGTLPPYAIGSHTTKMPLAANEYDGLPGEVGQYRREKQALAVTVSPPKEQDLEGHCDAERAESPTVRKLPPERRDLVRD